MSNSVTGTNAADLVPFTGYYTLDAGTGSFLLIDTNLIYIDGAISHEASITISADGVSSDTYAFAQCGAFADGVLTVAWDGQTIAQVTLAGNAGNGNITTLNGTVNGATVSAVNPFNPIPMSVFAAEYYDKLEMTTTPLYVAKFRIGADGSVAYNGEGGELQPVTQYAFNYAMFVIQFAAGGQTVTFEMGTAPGSGRVAGNSANGGMLVSIGKTTKYPPQQQADQIAA